MWLIAFATDASSSASYSICVFFNFFANFCSALASASAPSSIFLCRLLMLDNDVIAELHSAHWMVAANATETTATKTTEIKMAAYIN